MVFSLYAISTAGIVGILQLFIIYSIGLIFIIIRAREQKEQLFEKSWERTIGVIITILGVIGIIYLIM